MLFVSITGASSRCPADSAGAAPADGRAVRDGTGRSRAGHPGPPDPAPLALWTAPSPDEQRDFMRQSARSAWNFVARSMSSERRFRGRDRHLPVHDRVGHGEHARLHPLGPTARTHHAAQYQRAMIRVVRDHREDVALRQGGVQQAVRLEHRRDGRSPATRGATKGYGWSVLDHGRLLIWLKILAANDTAYTARAQAIVTRLDMKPARPRRLPAGRGPRPRRRARIVAIRKGASATSSTPPRASRCGERVPSARSISARTASR